MASKSIDIKFKCQKPHKEEEIEIKCSLPCSSLDNMELKSIVAITNEFIRSYLWEKLPIIHKVRGTPCIAFSEYLTYLNLEDVLKLKDNVNKHIKYIKLLNDEVFDTIENDFIENHCVVPVHDEREYFDYRSKVLSAIQEEIDQSLHILSTVNQHIEFCKAIMKLNEEKEDNSED